MDSRFRERRDKGFEGRGRGVVYSLAGDLGKGILEEWT